AVTRHLQGPLTVLRNRILVADLPGTFFVFPDDRTLEPEKRSVVWADEPHELIRVAVVEVEAPTRNQQGPVRAGLSWIAPDLASDVDHRALASPLVRLVPVPRSVLVERDVLGEQRNVRVCGDHVVVVRDWEPLPLAFLDDERCRKRGVVFLSWNPVPCQVVSDCRNCFSGLGGNPPDVSERLHRQPEREILNLVQGEGSDRVFMLL